MYGYAPPEENVPRPLISWGIALATVESLQYAFEQWIPTLGLDKVHIGINPPNRENAYPALVIAINNLKVKSSGFYSSEVTEPRTFVLKSEGSIGINIWGRSNEELLTLTDVISQMYLMNLLYTDSFFFPGTNRDYIGINLQPGQLEWSAYTMDQPPHTQEKVDQLFTTSTSWEFRAEHKDTYELARISAIDIEAIPLNRIVTNP